MGDDNWVEGVTGVKSGVVSCFKTLYSDISRLRPTLDGIDFNNIASDDSVVLTAPFSIDEIKEVVWSCEGDTSPGPDGFNFTFIKTFWEFIKDEVFSLVEEFYSNSALPRGVSSSFITLIPKRDNPQKVSDFRPISLIGCIHKLISELLANRLKVVIGSLISNCQSAFIANRQILDGVVAISEVVDLARKRGDECLILKVDFEKTYDSVD